VIFRRALLAALLVASLGSGIGETPDPPMTEEEVVRRHVAGDSARELVEEIERREPGFDVSTEMLEELRRAGIPDAVIEAMQQRQAAQNAAETGPVEQQIPPSVPQLTISIVRRGTRTLSINRNIHPQLAAEWELGNAPEDRVFAGMALYLACHTGRHVPDHWRNKSPLGVDFLSMRRHRMLLFVPGRSSGKEEGSDGLHVRLDLPRTIEVALEPGDEHNLSLGLALQIGGRYYRLTDDHWDGFVLDETGGRLEARVKGTNLKKFAVEFLRE
jgi:hypothetical protein